MAGPSSAQTAFIDPSAVQAFTISLLEAYSVPTAHASLVASNLISADLRGVDTHGMQRLPSYIARIRTGVLNANGTPTLTTPTPVVTLVDGNNVFGAVAADAGMSAAVASAETYGIGLASVRRSNHFGMAAWVVQRALDKGMLSLVFTNSSPAMPAWGGREKVLGVSPIACGAPGIEGSGHDFVLDMAPSVAARGKVHKALRRGERIPEGWALDEHGAMTDDPAEALKGVMLPMGGPKGSGLAVMMDVFSGVLSGSAFAGGVTGPYDASKEADVGHWLVAIKPDLFVSSAEFRERMEVLYQKVIGSERMRGVDRIYFPGEIEQEMERERRVSGIPFVKSEVDALNDEARRAGCRELVVSRWV